MRCCKSIYKFVAICLLAVSTSAWAQESFPGPEWDVVAKLENSGFQPDRLSAAQLSLAYLDTLSAMVVVDGKILFAYGPLATPSRVHSVRKSLLAGLYGSYVASGPIRLTKSLQDLGIDDVHKLTFSNDSEVPRFNEHFHDALKPAGKSDILINAYDVTGARLHSGIVGTENDDECAGLAFADNEIYLTADTIVNRPATQRTDGLHPKR